MIAVLRIAGRVAQNEKDEDTLARLKMRTKFSCILVDEKDVVRVGMIKAVAHMVAYGRVSEAFIKELKEKRGVKGSDVFFLHPPRGGFKKSSKVAYPQGILGQHEDISKLLKRML